MDVNVPQPFPHEAVGFYERKHFSMLYRNSHRQSFQKRKYDRSVLEVSTCELADDKWMAGNFPIVEQVHEPGVSLPKMRDPNRCVDKDHIYVVPLLGIGFSCLSVPPSLASLFPLSLAISASSPSLTNAVFSLIPVILGCLIDQLVIDVQGRPHAHLTI